MNLAPAVLAASPTLARLSKAGAARALDLTTASSQWSSRPAEERFWTLAEAATYAENISQRLVLSDGRPNAYTIAPHAAGGLALRHDASGSAARLAPLAFEQLARFAGAPASYLGSLSAPIAAAALDEGWTRRKAGNDGATPLRFQILDAGTDRVSVRAVTSTTHDLTPNATLLRALDEVASPNSGWKIPPARVPANYTGQTRVATSADVLRYASHEGMGVNIGDQIAPSGVYAGDRDCFALLVDDTDSGHMEEDGGLHRFLMVGNSETATGALEITTGWMRGVCGNHILWGARDIIDIRAIHRGNNASRMVGRLAHQISRRAWGDDRQETSAAIAAAKACQIADSKDDLIKILFSQKRISTKANIENAWDVSCELSHLDGNPGSAWGTINALTRLSQISDHASDRRDLDASAAKIFAMVATSPI